LASASPPAALISSTISCAGGPGIVHHDLGAVCRHQLRDLAADTAPRAGADRDPSVEHAHPVIPFLFVSSRGLSGPRPVLSIAGAHHPFDAFVME
jgi:hypothetical protein